jgi:hypothetical protein
MLGVGALLAVAVLEAHFTWRGLVKSRTKAPAPKDVTFGMCQPYEGYDQSVAEYEHGLSPDPNQPSGGHTT